MTGATQTERACCAAAPPARVTSAALMRGARKLLIEHEGEIYTLQITRQNKLLLTK